MDSIKKELNIITEILNAELEQSVLNGKLCEFVLGSSKRIRSKLGILYFKSQEIELTEKDYYIFAIGEIIHNASLLHDDVIDNADTRRNSETIGKAFNPKISILAGDYLMSIVADLLSSISNPNIFKTFTDCIKNMCDAEFKQYYLRGNLPALDAYLGICKNKTGVLFSSILKSVAINKQLDINKAEEFGKVFGICFQLKNDLETDSANNDIKNNIYTAKDILGIEKANILSDNYKEKLVEIIKDFPNNTYKTNLEDLIKSL